tara:strand:+ start:4794 stop:8345 length:3552 start_codon:yes stop_codon:yes gene_type:complete
VAHEPDHSDDSSSRALPGRVGGRTEEQFIIDSGYGEQYLLSNIQERLSQVQDELREIRSDVLRTADNWFDNQVRTNQYPRWIGEPSAYLETVPPRIFRYVDLFDTANAPMANMVQQLRSVIINGYVFYTIRSGLPSPRDTQNAPLQARPLTDQDRQTLRDMYQSAEGLLRSTDTLTTEAKSSLSARLVTFGVDTRLPTSNEAQQRLLQEGLGEDFGGGRLASATLATLPYEAKIALNIYINQWIWVYSVLQSQDNILPVEPPAIEPLALLEKIATIYKDSRFRQLIIESRDQAIREVRGERSFDIQLPEEVLRGELEATEDWVVERSRDILEDLVEAQFDDGPEQSPAERAQQRRLAEQTFLLDFLDQYSEMNQKRAVQHISDGGEPHFIMVHGQTDTIVNRLMYNPSMESLDNIKTSELSGLVPKIKIFKSTYLPSEDYLSGREIRHEIPFSSFIREAEIESMLERSFERGRGVGIKSFEWRLEGRDPFAARRDIFARLELYFQSMDELIRTRYVPTGQARYVDNNETYGDRDNRLSYRYVDLVNIGIAHPEKSFVWNPNYYKIEVEAGWYLPDGTGDASTFQSAGTREAIKNSTIILHLAAYDHDIQINDQGNVTLTIEYTAWQEGLYLGPDSDILTTPERRRDRLRYIKTLSDRQRSRCPQEYIADLQEAYKRTVRRQNLESWGRILNTLYDQDKVFYTKMNTDLLDTYLSDGRAAFAQPALQELGLRSPVQEFDPTENSNVENPPSRREIDRRTGQDIGGANIIASGSAGILESLKELQYGNDDDNYHLQFMYFGDLLEAALEVVHSDMPPVQGSYGSESKLKENTRIILGPISYNINKRIKDDPPEYTQETVYDINLADIPISVNYFIEWFISKVVGQERAIYPVLSFIREVASDLIANSVRLGGGERNLATQDLKLRTNFFTGGGTDRGDEEKLYTLRNAVVSNEGGSQDSNFVEADTSATYTRVDLDTLDSNSMPVLSAPERGRKSYDYMLLYAINDGAVAPLDGNRNNDKERGIYHFGIGKPEGIIKTINFTKTDIPFLRENRLEQEFLGQITGLAVLANVYNIKVQCYGTTMFFPGMKIYLNPIGLSPSFGSPIAQPGRRSPASVLGIGGYHVITKVQSYIERGTYTTELTAIWEAAGTSLGDPAAGDASAEPTQNEECRVQRKEIRSLITKMA